ncbi:MAG: hypothetical protein ACN4GR_06670 [Arenicellales bacterium]
MTESATASHSTHINIGLWPAILIFLSLAGLIYTPKLTLVSVLLLVYLLVFVRHGSSCSFCQGIQHRMDQVSGQKFQLHYLSLLIFSIAFLVVIFRDISLLTQPRFWAEDGRHFFEYAYKHDWLDTLLFHPEYRLFLSNISALIATRVTSLGLAPLPFSLIWLMIIASALAIVAWGNSPVWDTPAKKILVCAMIIFAPRSAEIWLNANGTQYYTPLITALILAESTVGSGIFKVYSFRILLALASINGVLSCLLTPLYWFKAFRHRNDRELIIQAAILSAGAVFQLFTLLMSSAHAERNLLSDASLFGWISWVKSVGLTFNTELAELLHNSVLSGAISIDSNTFTNVGYLLLSLWLLAVIFLAYRLRHHIAIYILASYVLLFLFVSIFGIAGPDNVYFIYPDLGNRYFLLTSALILISLYASIGSFTQGTKLRNSAVILSIILGLGLTNGIEQFYGQKLKREPTWPEWQAEVEKWNTDHRYILHIWPDPWVVNLQNHSTD